MKFTQIVDGHEIEFSYNGEGLVVFHHVRKVEEILPAYELRDHEIENREVEDQYDMKVSLNDLFERVRVLELYVEHDVFSVEKDLIRLNNKLFNLYPNWRVVIAIGNIGERMNKLTCAFNDLRHQCEKPDCDRCSLNKLNHLFRPLRDNPENDLGQILDCEKMVFEYLKKCKWVNKYETQYEYLNKCCWVNEYKIKEDMTKYTCRVVTTTTSRIDPIINSMKKKNVGVSSQMDYGDVYFLRLGSLRH